MGQRIRLVMACYLAGCQVAGLPAAPERTVSGTLPSALLKPETGQRDLLAGPAQMLFQQQGQMLSQNDMPEHLSQQLSERDVSLRLPVVFNTLSRQAKGWYQKPRG